MPEVFISAQARADLEDIWFYIAKDNIPAADRWHNNIRDQFKTLSKFPEIGRERPEINVVTGLRSLPVGKYVVFYQITESAVRIHRVLHGSMDIPSLFDFIE